MARLVNRRVRKRLKKAAEKVNYNSHFASFKEWILFPYTFCLDSAYTYICLKVFSAFSLSWPLLIYLRLVYFLFLSPQVSAPECLFLFLSGPIQHNIFLAATFHAHFSYQTLTLYIFYYCGGAAVINHWEALLRLIEMGHLFVAL